MTQHSSEFLELQAALAGEYSLQRELGRGGMGIVYLARDVQLDRDVAIKVLPPDLADTAASRERFMREARTAAGLSHPHIVPIHRVGEANGFVFFVMSYVEGETLGDRLRARGPLPPADATRVLREVAWALAYAHGRGIVHRDVKPDNILLEAGTGRALVTDFGIAHGGGDPGPATDPGKIMGTAYFMSPEQATNQPVDGRSDIYALGVVGYLAVSGRLPLDEPDSPSPLLLPSISAPANLIRVAPGIPPALAAAIDRCLDRDPANRFQDGETLAEALAPTNEARPALPPTLRAWLGARNPLLVPDMAWCGVIGTLTLANLIAWVTVNRPDGPADIVLLAGIASLPLLPILGFHLNQARLQFRAGHSLGDLRSALEIAKKERAEIAALAGDDEGGKAHRLLRIGTVAAGTWLAVTAGLVIQGTIHENQVGIGWILGPMFSTMLLGAVSNALDVRFIPTRIREWWQTGIRDRLWNSRVGEWFARQLGAPERSHAVGAGVFRPTEAALGVAAAELFDALPTAYRDQLMELPATVAALEARAAEARAEVEVVAALAPSGSEGAAVLERRRSAASSHLAASVAALEKIRVDLLRLHARPAELAPLTTLIDAANLLGDEAKRLAEAEREVDDIIMRRPPGSGKIPTPT